jgi:hypothetical protein
MLRSPRLLPLLLSFSCLSGLAAHADTIETFALSGDFAPGQAAFLGSPTGTVTVDTTLGVVDAVNLSFSNYGTYAANLTEDSPFISYGPEVEVAASWHENNMQQTSFAVEDIFLPVSSLIGYTGGAICSLDTPCADGMSAADYLTRSGDFLDGELTLESAGTNGDSDSVRVNELDDNAVAATPEPSGLVLLGTGLVGGAAMLCRKRSNEEEPTVGRTAPIS